MKIADQVEVLEIPMSFAGRTSVIHPVLLRDDDGSSTLIDTGMPGQLEQFRELMQKAGVPLSSLARIIITHQDIDHIGGAQALVDESHAEVFAHPDDKPYIQGELPLIKMNAERIAAMVASLPESERDAARAMFAHPPRVRVDKNLSDGQELPFHGGIVVIHTPGHTPGHVSLYLRKHRILVSGDAMVVQDGVLSGPNPGATPNLEQATKSLSKLVAYPIDRVVCYHGGLSPAGASERIRELCAG